jgi:transcriptional antiterminator
LGEISQKSSEKIILTAIRKNNQITIKELAKLAKQTTRTVEKIISKLKTKEIPNKSNGNIPITI